MKSFVVNERFCMVCVGCSGCDARAAVDTEVGTHSTATGMVTGIAVGGGCSISASFVSIFERQREDEKEML